MKSGRITVDGDAGPGQAGGDRIAKLLDDAIGEGYKRIRNEF